MEKLTLIVIRDITIDNHDSSWPAGQNPGQCQVSLINADEYGDEWGGVVASMILVSAPVPNFLPNFIILPSWRLEMSQSNRDRAWQFSA